MDANYHEVEVISSSQKKLIYTKHYKTSCFYDEWHFHDAIEVVYIKKGEGIRYLGDSIEYFNKPEVVLINKDIPHVWRSCDKNRDFDLCESFVLQLDPKLSKEFFQNYVEFESIRNLLVDMNEGILFEDDSTCILGPIIERIVTNKDIVRLLDLILLFHTMSKLSYRKLLDSSSIKYTSKLSESKISQMIRFIFDNFLLEISIEEMSTRFDLSKSSFCRYFKKKTGITFSTFVNNIRIEYACRLMINKPELLISEVMYRSGFNSNSYFNIQFKHKKGLTPREYKKSVEQKKG